MFFKIFFLSLLVIIAGAFGWLALTDMPVAQQEIVVDIPVAR